MHLLLLSRVLDSHHQLWWFRAIWTYDNCTSYVAMLTVCACEADAWSSNEKMYLGRHAGGSQQAKGYPGTQGGRRRHCVRHHGADDVIGSSRLWAGVLIRRSAAGHCPLRRTCALRLQLLRWLLRLACPRCDKGAGTQNLLRISKNLSAVIAPYSSPLLIHHSNLVMLDALPHH